MKTIPTIAMTFALALSLSACSATAGSLDTMPSSVVGKSVPTVTPAFYPLERDGAPIPIPVSADHDVSTLEESTSNPPPSMKHMLISFLSEVLVACVNSGNCW
ncbi:hypothetical protein [Thiothrix fructosivorans]|uniref:Secreted protein n=1 Tax=Thiothrix fructosivorans TaxID=111770 RepID=A0A8B0SGQ5_9GAMM|nr:hypothetical protein [Thiothrix fructosivorans]MBO0611819.1 hypothetical protein [Thiothrix fructosivorans]QTX10526.1 hypothetical protein J1836_018465 [Thiothrix fructosivorans]